MLKRTPDLERLEHYLEREIQGMLKSFLIRRNKKTFTRIFGIFPILSRVILVCLGYFLFILSRSCLFQLVAVRHGLFHILYKKVQSLKAREKLENA